jgi:isopentenyldiphosphate isomerase
MLRSQRAKVGGIRKKFLCELGNESMCEDIGRVLDDYTYNSAMER